MWYKFDKMAMPDQTTNPLTGQHRRNTMTNVKNVVQTETVTPLAHTLGELGADATQQALEPIVANYSVTQLVAVDHEGQRISGSAERAIAALINFRLVDAMATAGQHWSEVIHREVSDLAKALAPLKAEFFTANKGHSNTSTKWSRLRKYGYELSYPKVTAPIGEDAEGEEGADGADGEGAGTTSRTRDLYARYVVELGRLYRAGINAENDVIIKNHAKGDKIIAALEAVTAALKALDAPLEDEDLKAFMAAQK